MWQFLRGAGRSGAFSLGLAALISYGTTYYLFGVLIEPLRREFGWSQTLILSAYSSAILFSGLLGIPIGRWVDRHGARALMTAGSALSGLSLVWLSTLQAPWQLYLGWAVGTGLGNALTLYPVSFAVVIKRTSENRGAALAVLTLLGGLASPLLVPLAGLLTRDFGWRETLIFMGCLNLLVAVPLNWWALRGDGPAREHEVQPSMGAENASAREALRSAPFWLLTCAIALVQLASRIVIAHQIPFITGRTADALFAASVAGMVGLASLPGRFGLNYLSDRILPQRLLSFSLAVGAVGVVVLILATSPAALWAYVAIFGFSFGAIWPLQASVMADQFGQKSYASILAMQGVPVAICAAVGPITAAWLVDITKSYIAAFWLAAGLFLLSAFLVFVTARPRFRVGRPQEL